jgi:hypothetical protein
MPNLSTHVRLTNTQRLMLAHRAFSDLDPSPLPAREQLSGTVRSLRQAVSPGPSRSEQTLYSACHQHAQALQRILDAPPLDFTENVTRFDTARHQREQQP